MKAQIYGILGLMYALAIGILLIVALVGTSKQFTWQSSAPMYKLSMIMLSSNMQKVKAFISQERVYAVDRAAFYTGAFGGYSTFSDLVPKMDARLCGCPAGSSLSQSGNNYYCDKNEEPVKPNLCFVTSDGKKLDVHVLNKSLSSYIPEKYFVYWYNGTNNIPSKNKIVNTTEQYMSYLFSVPDPRIVIPLKLLGAQMDFQYVAKVKNFSKDYIDVEWIPIGSDSIILSFPYNHPFMTYWVKIAFENHVKNNLFSLYDKAKSFVENKEFNSVFDNPSTGVLPTVIDENYVTGYTKKDVGSYHCNYSMSDRPDGNPKCSTNNVNVNNLEPMVALVYYVDKYYWDNDSSSRYYTNNMGSQCSSCSRPDYLTLDENSLEKSLPCTAEINSTIKNGLIVFRIENFYGKCDDTLKCMTCAIVSNLNKKVGGDIVDGNYTNALTNENYSIKMLPLQVFNLTLNGFDKTTTNWNKTSFSRWISAPSYAMNYSSGCNNITHGGQVAADSICLMNGFQKADECSSDGNYYGSVKKWKYNITRYRIVNNVPSNYFKIDELACSHNGRFEIVNIKDSSGKFSVLAELKGYYGYIQRGLDAWNDFLEKDSSNLWKLDYICRAVNSNSSDYVKSVYLSHEWGSNFGNINITANTSHKYNGGYYVKNITCNNSVTYSTEFPWNTYAGTSGCHDYVGRNFSGGVPWANLFCQVKAKNLNVHAIGFCAGGSANSRYPPILDANKYSGGNFSIRYIICNSNTSKTYYLGTLPHVINSNRLHINEKWIPFNMIQVYQPENFVSQTISLKRICYENGYGGPVWVRRNNSANSPYLIYDAGGSSTTTSGYNLNKIKCEIK